MAWFWAAVLAFSASVMADTSRPRSAMRAAAAAPRVRGALPSAAAGLAATMLGSGLEALAAVLSGASGAISRGLLNSAGVGSSSVMMTRAPTSVMPNRLRAKL